MKILITLLAFSPLLLAAPPADTPTKDAAPKKDTREALKTLPPVIFYNPIPAPPAAPARPAAPPAVSPPPQVAPPRPITPIYLRNTTLNTTVHPMANPSIKKMKGGDPAQTYLGNLADMRDLDIIIANAKAAATASANAAQSFGGLLGHQRRLHASGVISLEELQQSEFDLASATALVKAYDGQARASQARYDQKEYQARVAAKKDTYRIEALYALYKKEWIAQCEASKGAVEAAEAQLTLNRAAYQRARLLYERRGISHFDVEARQRDVVSAEQDVAAKKYFDDKCPTNWPTIEDLRAMQNELE